MIKVCHIADHLNGEVDGVYTHILEIIKLTNKQKYEHFLCFQGNKKIEKEIIGLGGKLIILPQLSSKLPLVAIIKFMKLVKENKIQIVHAHFLKSYIISGLSNVLLRKKLIYNFHGLFIVNEYNNIFIRLLYQFCHFLICWLKGVQLAITPSKESKKQLFSETKLFPRIDQYYNGAIYNDDNNFVDQSIIDRIKASISFKLIYVGRIEQEKRVDRAIKIIYHLKNSGINVHLFIVGSGSLENKIIRLIDDLDLNKDVSLFGVIPNPESYFIFFDCLLLTSDREGMPFVVWESMAKGLPILSSTVGGVTEVLEDAKCGLVFDQKNISDAIEKAKIIIGDNQLREKLSYNGRNAIKKKYTIEKFVIFINDLYFNLTLENE